MFLYILDIRKFRVPLLDRSAHLLTSFDSKRGESFQVHSELLKLGVCGKVHRWTFRLRSSVADSRVSMPVAAGGYPTPAGDMFRRMPSMDSPFSMGSMDDGSMSMHSESPIEHTHTHTKTSHFARRVVAISLSRSCN